MADAYAQIGKARCSVACRLGEGADPKSSDLLEVATVPGREVELVLERCCRNERVRETYARLTSHSPCSLGHDAIDGELTERTQELRDSVARGRTGEQLGPCDHRVVQTMPCGLERNGAT